MRGGQAAAREFAPGDFHCRVCQVVASLAKGGPPDVHLAAHYVRTSVRTLQRRLHGARQTYAGILQQVRCQAAEQMLTEPTRKISDVARALGYSDPGHFTRAFRRWTGLTPGDFRRRHMPVPGPTTANESVCRARHDRTLGPGAPTSRSRTRNPKTLGSPRAFRGALESYSRGLAAERERVVH